MFEACLPQGLSKLPDVVVSGGKATMEELSKMQKAAEKCINGTTVTFATTMAEASELVKKANHKNLLDSMLAAVAQM